MSKSIINWKHIKHLLALELADLHDVLSSCNLMGCSGAVTVSELVQITRRHSANFLNNSREI